MRDITFFIFIDHSEGNSLGKPVLVICKIFGLFVNTLTASNVFLIGAI